MNQAVSIFLYSIDIKTWSNKQDIQGDSDKSISTIKDKPKRDNSGGNSICPSLGGIDINSTGIKKNNIHYFNKSAIRASPKDDLNSSGYTLNTSIISKNRKNGNLQD